MQISEHNSLRVYCPDESKYTPLDYLPTARLPGSDSLKTITVKFDQLYSMETRDVDSLAI